MIRERTTYRVVNSEQTMRQQALARKWLSTRINDLERADEHPNDCHYCSLIAETDALLSQPLRFYALVSSQGTACAETTLREDDFTEANRRIMEGTIDQENPDKPIPGTWVDVTDNEACIANYNDNQGAG